MEIPVYIYLYVHYFHGVSKRMTNVKNLMLTLKMFL